MEVWYPEVKSSMVPNTVLLGWEYDKDTQFAESILFKQMLA